MTHTHSPIPRLILAVLALAGSLTACQREVVADNPTYDPVAKTVNTQFVVSISPGTGSSGTKQSADDVQASDNSFRGIEAAHILAYSLNYQSASGDYFMFKPNDDSSTATRDFDMGTLVTSSDITPYGDNPDNRRIIELALPLETNTILIYGRAPKTKSNDEQGYVDYSGTALNSKLSNVKFQLHTRLDNYDVFSKTSDLFGRILTGIMAAGGTIEINNNETTFTRNTYKFWWPRDATSKEFPTTDDPDAHPGYTLYSETKTWKDYGDAYRANPGSMSIALEAAMGEAYAEMMYLKGATPKEELRAGAASAIARMLSDLYNVLNRVTNATPVVYQEYLAQLVASEAKSRIDNFFNYDPTIGINFKDKSDILTSVNTFIPGKTENDYVDVPESAFYYKKTNADDEHKEYEGFPSNMHLPLGAAILHFMEVPPAPAPKSDYIVVTYENTIPTYGMGNGENFDIKNYCYPAELVYYTNSSLRTSVEPMLREKFPRTPGAWASTINWDGSYWTANKVSSTTRTVAVNKPINYGTAVLKSQFAYSASTIFDNNKGVHPNESNNVIPVNGENRPFLVTGIIIGGVDKSVGWNFLPNGDNFNYFVYDNLLNGDVAIPKYVGSSALEYSSPVYTCTWDNYDKTQPNDKQSPVYIGLELVNNTGMDIWGELNLIRDGGTFYLVAELDPTKGDVPATMKKNGQVDLSRSDFYYPPFNEETGATINAPRVFMQDYMTTAKFTFGPESLRHAYVTMPDLRSGQISLGLSVDLTWQPGLEFTAEMGNVTGN